MRKADYAWLANALRLKIGIFDEARRVAAPDDPNREVLRGKSDALRELAYSAASALNVDRSEFLRACGIKPP